MARAQKRQDLTIDKVLADVEEAKRRIAEHHKNLALVRRGHVPPPLDPTKYTAEEQRQAQGREEYIQQVNAEVERLRGEIKKMWGTAAGLSDAPGRLAGDDAAVEAQIGALTERLRSLQKLGGHHREDSHDRLDMLLDEQRTRAAGLLSGEVGRVELELLGTLAPFLDDGFAAKLHEAIDARPDSEFSPGARSSWRAELDLLSRQIQRRQKELALRAEERRFTEAEADKARAEVELAEAAK